MTEKNIERNISPVERCAHNDENDSLRSDFMPSVTFINDLPQWKYSIMGTVFTMDEEEKKFQNFMATENSLVVHGALTVIASIINIAHFCKSLVQWPSNAFVVFVALKLIVVFSLWVHLYFVFQKKRNSTKLWSIPFHHAYLGDAVLIANSLFLGLFLFGMTAFKDCSSTASSAHTQFCTDYIPMHQVVGYVVISMMFSVLVKCRHVGAVILSILIEMVILALLVYLIEPIGLNVVALVVIFIVHCFVAFDCDSYSRRLYLLLIASQKHVRANVMSENEALVMEMQSTELRFLIGNVAHDLKTPLQAFTYELDKMKGQGVDDSIVLLDSICSFMLMTINRAIDYTKVTSGIQLKPSMETVNMVGVFDWVKRCVGQTATNTAVSITLDPLPKEMCNFIITDKQWLMENLLCLISNAQKFTAHGAIQVAYSFDGVFPAGENRYENNTEHNNDSESMIMVEVIDDGIGISEEMQLVLFKPFKQAMRRAGGTGLGIYSMSKRVESLGGKCGVSSRADGKCGARFWFTLPYRPDTTVSDGTISLALSSEIELQSITPMSVSRDIVRQQSKDDLTDPPASSVAILLVEDSPLIQKTCARSFLREGITIDIATNGLECLEKVLKTSNRYKVILMDINMPLMDGLEATERIRQWEKTTRDVSDESGLGHEKDRLLIIGVSANSDSQSEKEALDVGMDRFISKPMKISVVGDTLKDFGVHMNDFRFREQK